MPQLQLLTSKETKLNALQFVREVASLSYKKLQAENGRTGKIVEAIMMIERGSVSFTHGEDTKTTRKIHVNGSTYFHKSSQLERTIMQYKGVTT